MGPGKKIWTMVSYLSVGIFSRLCLSAARTWHPLSPLSLSDCKWTQPQARHSEKPTLQFAVWSAFTFLRLSRGPELSLQSPKLWKGKVELSLLIEC